MKKQFISFSIILTLSLFAFPNLVSAQFCCCETGCLQDAFGLGCPGHCNAFSTGTAVSGTFPDAGCGGNTCSVVVPVELTHFDIKSFGTEVEINWGTASEENNEGFEIYRASGIKMEWELVGFVSGNGTTFDAIEYFFMDRTPPPGMNYYRLKQIDFDGTATFSDMKVATLKEKEELDLWPTLAKDQIFIKSNLELYQQNRKLKVFDMMGRQVIEQALTEPMLDISHLSKGQYILNIIGPGGHTETLRFVKIQ